MGDSSRDLYLDEGIFVILAEFILGSREPNLHHCVETVPAPVKLYPRQFLANAVNFAIKIRVATAPRCPLWGEAPWNPNSMK